MDKDSPVLQKSVCPEKDAECLLIQAKLRFIKAAEVYEPLAVVRRNPFTSMGCALMAGLIAGTLRGNALAGLMAQSALRVGTLAAQYFMERNK